jgi:tetratricopeptide (TPR) repeat protein
VILDVAGSNPVTHPTLSPNKEHKDRLMHKRKDEIRDIYQNRERDLDKDFTPQVAKEVFESRQRDLRRSRIFSFFFGVLAVALSITLAALIIRNLMIEKQMARELSKEDVQAEIRQTLTPDTLWIMDYQPDPAEDDAVVPAGPAPVSAKWIKQAAYYTIQGQQALALNQQNEALDYFQKVAGLYPDIRGLHLSMGLLYLQQKNYEPAVTHLEKAFQEEDSFVTALNLGIACSGLKAYDRAETCFKRAMELQPGSPDGHKNLADLYRKMNRVDEAVFHFGKYLDLRPNDLDTRQSYALFLTKTERWKDAAEELTKLTKDLPDVAPLYFLLAQSRVKSNQPEKAVEALGLGARLIDPGLAQEWIAREEFSVLRNRNDFKLLADGLKTPGAL